MWRSLVMGFLMLVPGNAILAQPPAIRPPIYDEAQVPAYTLPHVLEREDGSRVTSPQEWPAHREWLVSLLAEQEYGWAPSEEVRVECEKVEQGPYGGSNAQGIAILRRQYVVTIARRDRQHRIDLLVWSPADAAKPAGCFLGLNFRGNQTTSDDPSVRITTGWCDSRSPGVVDHRATEATRGTQSDRWPIPQIVGAGYAVATAYYGDIDPDFDDGFENGVHALFPDFRCDETHPNRWGTISAWAWGLSRLADALQKVEGIDPTKMMVFGHSRLGKTALWAGANDPRFALVISNNSGCGGAALSKRCVGESVAAINRSFPHWFNRNFRAFNDAEEKLPFDQHQLVAAIAPRPVYIASASEDRWADPLGEWLSGHHASPAYELLGREGLVAGEWPPVNTVIGGAIGYHLREGPHDLTPYDWEQFVAFAIKHGL